MFTSSRANFFLLTLVRMLTSLNCLYMLFINIYRLL